MSKSSSSRTALAVALPLLAGLGACKREAPPPPPEDPSRYAFYMVNYPFGGQRPEWWEEAISAARPGGANADPKQHALLLERAQRNGLAVTEDNGAVRVRPDEATTKLLLERLEQSR